METELFCKYLLERVITSPFVYFFVVEIHVFLSRKGTLSSTKAKQHQNLVHQRTTGQPLRTYE